MSDKNDGQQNDKKKPLRLIHRTQDALRIRAVGCGER